VERWPWRDEVNPRHEAGCAIPIPPCASTPVSEAAHDQAVCQALRRHEIFVESRKTSPARIFSSSPPFPCNEQSDGACSSSSTALRRRASGAHATPISYARRTAKSAPTPIRPAGANLTPRLAPSAVLTGDRHAAKSRPFSTSPTDNSTPCRIVKTSDAMTGNHLMVSLPRTRVRAAPGKRLGHGTPSRPSAANARESE